VLEQRESASQLKVSGVILRYKRLCAESESSLLVVLPNTDFGWFVSVWSLPEKISLDSNFVRYIAKNSRNYPFTSGLYLRIQDIFAKIIFREKFYSPKMALFCSNSCSSKTHRGEKWFLAKTNSR